MNCVSIWQLIFAHYWEGGHISNRACAWWGKIGLKASDPAEERKVKRGMK